MPVSHWLSNTLYKPDTINGEAIKENVSPPLCSGQELEQWCPNDNSLVTGSLFAPAWLTDLSLGTYLVQCLPGLKPIPKINRKLKLFSCSCAGRVCYLSESNCLTPCWAPTKWSQTMTVTRWRGTTCQVLCWSYHLLESSWIILFLWNKWHVQMPTCRTPPKPEPTINSPQRLPNSIKLLLQQDTLLPLNSN